MRFCVNIDLPERHLRVGQLSGTETLAGNRSYAGARGRETNRFFPIIEALEYLCQVNQWQIRRRPDLPSLYRSGVYYQAEPPGEEEWLDIPTLYKQGFGDCEDLACARVGELRERFGIAAVPAIRSKDFAVKGTRVTLVHVLVLWPDGGLEDPSKALGMKGDYQ